MGSHRAAALQMGAPHGICRGGLAVETNGLTQETGWSGVLAVLRLAEELALLFLSGLRKIGLFSLCIRFLKNYNIGKLCLKQDYWKQSPGN